MVEDWFTLAALTVVQGAVNTFLVLWASSGHFTNRDHNPYLVIEFLRCATNLCITTSVILCFVGEAPVWTLALTGALAYGYLWPNRYHSLLYVADLSVFSLALYLAPSSASQMWTFIALYVMCGFHSSSLMGRIEHFTEQQRRRLSDLECESKIIARRKAETDALNAELEATNNDLAKLSRHDALTQLLNRRGLSRIIERTNSVETTVVLIDCDEFKAVNESLGHSSGDFVLMTIARRLRNALRVGDYIARVGGDEFLVLMPNTTIDDATIAATRLCASVSGTPIDLKDDSLLMTVSAGVSPMPSSASSVTDLLAATRKALQESKASGKNRVSASHAPA